MNIRKTTIAMLISTAFAVPAFAGDMDHDDHESKTTFTQEFKGEARDAWIDGKLEATYMINRGLSSFDIGTKVNNGEVLLHGAVENDAQRQLAEQIALATDGVVKVDNQLVVQDDARTARSERTFGDKVEDATLAATLKTKLLVNTEVAGTSINVDVENGEATLNGMVKSREEAELAEYIARNTDGVVKVHNRLEIAS